jgi:hypothetical protein
MRVPRLVAVALWLLVAALAVAGFANFSPQAAPEPTATTTTTSPLPVRGSATGQVMARALAAGLRTPSDTLVPLADDPELDPLATGQTLPQPPDPTTTSTVTTTTLRQLASTTKTTLSSSTPLSDDEAKSIIALFFKPEDVTEALKIAKCESTLIPDNVNESSGAAGLFQQLPKYWPERAAAAGWGANANILDPYANTAVAAWLKYNAGGWSHWTCYRG